MFVLLFSLFTLSISYSQSLGESVVSSSGTTITGTLNTLSFTVGETTIGTITNGESLGQGFWQGAIEEVTLSNKDFTFKAQTTVYPNPVIDYLNLNFNEMAGQDFELLIYDSNGRQVFQKELSNSPSNEKLNFNDYSTGIYVLNIVQRSTNKSINFKIIKQ